MNISNKLILTILIAVHTTLMSYAVGQCRVETIIEQPTCYRYGTMKIVDENNSTSIVVLPKLAHTYDASAKCSVCGAIIQKPGYQNDSKLTRIDENNYRDFGLTESNWTQKIGHYAICNTMQLYEYFEMFETIGSTHKPITSSAFLADDVLMDHVPEFGLDLASGVEFDGMGHCINMSPCHASGLFRYNYGRISNLGLITPRFIVDDDKAYAGFVAEQNYGLVENCFVFLGVIQRKSEKTKLGGIIGNNIATGIIENCYSIANTGQVAFSNMNVHHCIALLENSSYEEIVTSKAFIDSLNASGYGRCIPWRSAKVDSCHGIPTLTGSTRWTSPIIYVPKRESTCTEEGYEEHYECQWCGKGLVEEDHSMIFHYQTYPPIPHRLVRHEPSGHVWSCLTPYPAEYWTCNICSGYFKDKDGKEPFQWVEPHNHTLEHVPYKYDCIKGGHEEYWKCTDCNNVFSASDPTTDEYLTDDNALNLLPNFRDLSTESIFSHEIGPESYYSQMQNCYKCTFTSQGDYYDVAVNLTIVDFFGIIGFSSQYTSKIEITKGSTVLCTGEICSFPPDRCSCTLHLDSLKCNETIEIKMVGEKLTYQYDGTPSKIKIKVKAAWGPLHEMDEADHPGALVGACVHCQLTDAPYIHQGIGTTDIPLIGDSHIGFTATIPIDLNDDNEYNSDIEFSAPMVSYSCGSMNIEKWHPLYLPFNINVENNLFSHCEFAIVQDLKLTDSEGRFIDNYVPGCLLAVTAQMVEPDYVIPANTLALIRPRHADVKFILQDIQMMPSAEQSRKYTVGRFNFGITGTLHTYTGNGWWVLNDKEGFDCLTSPQLLKPYSWYMTNASGNDADADKLLKNAKLYVIEIGGGDTSVKDIHEGDTGMISDDTGIYNLQGQQVSAMQKGHVYIVNGKKILYK